MTICGCFDSVAGSDCAAGGRHPRPGAETPAATRRSAAAPPAPVKAATAAPPNGKAAASVAPPGLFQGTSWVLKLGRRTFIPLPTFVPDPFILPHLFPQTGDTGGKDKPPQTPTKKLKKNPF